MYDNNDDDNSNSKIFLEYFLEYGFFSIIILIFINKNNFPKYLNNKKVKIFTLQRNIPFIFLLLANNDLFQNLIGKMNYETDFIYPNHWKFNSINEVSHKVK